MRKSRFTEAQIIGMIKEQEAGMPTAEVCIDLVEICSCYKGEGSDECDDGRPHQTVDGEAQDSACDRDHPRQDDDGGGISVVRSFTSEIDGRVDDAKRGMEDALRANPLEIREQHEKQLKHLQDAYGEGRSCAIHA